MSVYMQDFVLTELFLEMNLDTNEGGTRNLVLRGNDLIKKVGRRICDNDILFIAPFLQKHPEIVSLDMPYNDIGNCGVYNLMKHIGDHPTIRYLNLVGNNIGPAGAKAIAELGEDLPFFVLRLSSNPLEDEGGKFLSELLYLDIPLRELDISDSHQTMAGIAYILTGLMYSRGGSDRLEVIDIGRPLQQFYHQMCDAHAAEFFGQVVQYNTALREFHAQQYQLDFRDMEIFLNGLMLNNTLSVLDFNNNNIGDDGVDYLCKYLRTGPPLSALMIGANNFGDKGARGLSFNLPFSNIKLLDISHNHVTDVGILDILYTIYKREPMRALFLWGNSMTSRSLVLVNHLLLQGVLTQEHLDIKIYVNEDGLKAAWNSSANKYTHRFYCVSDYGHPPMRKVTKNPPKPDVEPDINFKHHVDDKELGMPLYGV